MTRNSDGNPTNAHTPTYRTVTREQLRVGDHIVQRGAFGIKDLTHHALYIGDGLVLHYYGNPYIHPGLFSKFSCSIRIDPITVLNKRAKHANAMYIVQTHPHQQFDSDVVVKRGLVRLGEQDYNLFTNNCEHFVNWAIDDKHHSHQVHTLL